MNKLNFNNLVVTNKKKIQQIKAHTIQKLIQKIKKLKYFLDKEPEHEKNKERFRKATFILDEMKKLKCVALMKNVLVLEKAPLAILTNRLSSPEETAVAMVATNKDMQRLVIIFKEKLGITDENNAWKNVLMQASKKQIKILRTEKKRKGRKDSKEQKAMALKRMEWLKNRNITHTNNDIDDKSNEIIEEYDEGANISTLGYWKIESIEGKNLNKHTKNAKNDKKVLPKEQLNISKNGNQKRKDIPKNIHKVVSEYAKLSETNGFVTNENNTIANMINDSLESASELNSKESIEVAAPENNTTHVVDPFFITDSGENYRSSAVVVCNGKPLYTDIHNARKTKKFVVDKDKNTRDIYNSPNFRSKVNNSRIERSAANNNVENNFGDLHPSWAAKQKLKPVIGSFQGNKIKFEEEIKNYKKCEINNSKKDYAKSKSEGQVTAKKRKNNTQNKIDALHPSWAAKQKFKATITEFRGKKTTFGEKGLERNRTEHINGVVPPFKTGYETKNLSDKLHPSWLAKQKQNKAIACFQGKKITFEDND